MRNLRNDTEQPTYDPVMKFMHWLTLGLIVTVFVLAHAIDMVPRTEKELVTQLHQSVGATIWVTTIARLAWRQFARLPDWPTSMSRFERIVTKASEYALYALLLVQPMLGLIHANAHGDALNLYLLGNIPPVTGTNRPFAHAILEVHETVGNALLVLIGLHAAAGLLRHFRRHDNALRAMLPRWT
jgi:cytochrome b561